MKQDLITFIFPHYISELVLFSKHQFMTSSDDHQN